MDISEAQLRIIARQEIAALAGFMLQRMRDAAVNSPNQPLATNFADFLDQILKPACSGWPPNDGSPKAPGRING